jgi:sugar lactone lactonase YvrE
VFVGDVETRAMGASAGQLRFAVPAGTAGGLLPVRVEPEGLHAGSILVARPIATGLHQVDSPAFDGLGRLYVTHSGSRGVKVPVPLYRVSADGAREPLTLDLPNPTSMALGPDGAMYVSSRFEGQVYRLAADDRAEVYAADLGVPTGLAFSSDGTLFVGDRSGSIFRVSKDRQVDVFASLPASVAAFHLAFGPDDCLYVSAPTLSAHDAVYRITPDRLVDTLGGGFGRPQGMAFASDGMLYVADALAGASGVVRVDVRAPEPELVAVAPVLIGLAFDPDGGLILATSDTVWRLDVPLSGAAPFTLPAS